VAVVKSKSRMQGLKRKIVYVVLFEGIALLCATFGLAKLSGNEYGHSGALAVATSVVAVTWTMIYNTLFEAWESRQSVRGRSFRRRVAYTAGFETGLIVLLVPLIAWWFGITLWQALVLDLVLVVFFVCYTFAFSWAFDRVFGLPASAAPRPQ
jgi:uncharacterized membrane protein